MRPFQLDDESPSASSEPERELPRPGIAPPISIPKRRSDPPVFPIQADKQTDREDRLVVLDVRRLAGEQRLRRVPDPEFRSDCRGWWRGFLEAKEPRGRCFDGSGEGVKPVPCFQHFCPTRLDSALDAYERIAMYVLHAAHPLGSGLISSGNRAVSPEQDRNQRAGQRLRSAIHCMSRAEMELRRSRRELPCLAQVPK